MQEAKPPQWIWMTLFILRFGIEKDPINRQRNLWSKYWGWPSWQPEPCIYILWWKIYRWHLDFAIWVDLLGTFELTIPLHLSVSTFTWFTSFSGRLELYIIMHHFIFLSICFYIYAYSYVRIFLWRKRIMIPKENPSRAPWDFFYILFY